LIIFIDFIYRYFTCGYSAEKAFKHDHFYTLDWFKGSVKRQRIRASLYDINNNAFT
jgi:hypothetical protein